MAQGKIVLTRYWGTFRPVNPVTPTVTIDCSQQKAMMGQNTVSLDVNTIVQLCKLVDDVYRFGGDVFAFDAGKWSLTDNIKGQVRKTETHFTDDYWKRLISFVENKTGFSF